MTPFEAIRVLRKELNEMMMDHRSEHNSYQNVLFYIAMSRETFDLLKNKTTENSTIKDIPEEIRQICSIYERTYLGGERIEGLFVIDSLYHTYILIRDDMKKGKFFIKKVTGEDFRIPLGLTGRFWR